MAEEMLVNGADRVHPVSMQVTLEIPDCVVAGLNGVEGGLTAAILEALAVEGYRTGRLSTKQIGLLLGHGSRWETEDFLSAHGAWPGTTAEEAAEDSRAVSKLLRE